MPRKKSRVPPEEPRAPKSPYKGFVPKRRPKFTFEEIAEALKECKGRLYQTADKLDMGYTTLYRYFNRYPKLKKIRKQFRGLKVDKAEEVMEKLVEDGNIAAVKWTLAAYPEGRARGWGIHKKIEQTTKVEIKGTALPQITEEKKKDLLDQVRAKQKPLEIGLKELGPEVVDAEIVEDGEIEEEKPDNSGGNGLDQR